ncbi:MAG: MOSC domain-containing protein [Sphingomonadales bacterium]|nr:MOSC domain-containing protein [Sphingomonadales bacterium]
MTGRLVQILRHPIKSIGLEEIEGASLSEGGALPFDREWAVLTERAMITREADGRASAWGPKVNFVIGRSAPALMQVTARETAPGRWGFAHPAAPDLEIAPAEPADQARLIDWLRPLWPQDAPAPTAVVRAPGQPLCDEAYACLSLIGTASLADLSARAGQDLSRRRFRANLWVDGLAPFAEFALVGRRLRIGSAEFEGHARVGRCRATDTNPATGLRDIDMLRTLQAEYGHTDLGVFLKVVKAGAIARGDTIEVL